MHTVRKAAAIVSRTVPAISITTWEKKHKNLSWRVVETVKFRQKNNGFYIGLLNPSQDAMVAFMKVEEGLLLASLQTLTMQVSGQMQLIIQVLCALIETRPLVVYPKDKL